MKRIVVWFAALAVALTAMAIPVRAAGVNSLGVTDYSGNWWNPSQNGMGLSIIEQNGILFIIWFAYDAQQHPMWLIMSGTPARNAQGLDTLTAQLLVTRGPQPMGYDQSKLSVLPSIGSATITFTDAYNAVWNYAYQDPTGGPPQSGSINLTEMQFGCVEPAKWNSTFCVVPKDIMVADPKVVPQGCTSASMQCWKDAVNAGTVKLIGTPAKMVGLTGNQAALATRPIMAGYYINSEPVNSSNGPYSLTVLYADTGEPVSTPIGFGFTTPIDWAKGTTDGVLFHQTNGTCWLAKWFPPNQTGPSGGWGNVPVSCQ